MVVRRSVHDRNTTKTVIDREEAAAGTHFTDGLVPKIVREISNRLAKARRLRVARTAEAAVIGDLLQLWLGKDKIGYRNAGVYPPTSCIGMQTPTSVYESELRCFLCIPFARPRRRM